MKVLKDNNLIIFRKDGNKNLYKLNYVVLDDIILWFILLSFSIVLCICEIVEKGEC